MEVFGEENAEVQTVPATAEEWRRDNGELHRENGPAWFVSDAATGAVICEEWWRDGQQHRDGGPAVIARDPASGAVTYEEWWRDGRLHREDRSSGHRLRRGDGQ